MNIKKLDDKDIAFIDEPWSEEELKQFSEFLRNRKLKSRKRSSAVRKRVPDVKK